MKAPTLAALLPSLLTAALLASSGAASTFVPVTKKCPIGGEKFKCLEQASSTSWGQLPDGMTLGTGPNPGRLPQCPTNGLVMYRDFDKPAVQKLTAIIARADYQALRTTETPYYLAYWLATRLGDETPAWLLLAAGWEAKNEDPASPRARRYAEEFVALVTAMPASDKDFGSIALRARAANALREIGRFGDAETLRASIKIADDAGGPADADVRKGWADFLTLLAAPIARGDPSRAPIDMIGEREAAFRCLAPAMKVDAGAAAVPPLSPFEASYCARPEVAKAVAEAREALGDQLAN